MLMGLNNLVVIVPSPDSVDWSFNIVLPMAATNKVSNASASADDDELLSSVSMKGNGEVMEKGRSNKGIYLCQYFVGAYH